ncbi:MAG: tol-pal system protein YbgF [Legionella sp.]|nr:tol-pal system protein YbgF [Legionella sp.]
MIRGTPYYLALFFSALLPLYAFAQAPVVDDSENFAILDEQQAAHEQPVAKTQLDYGDTEEEIALAQDNDMDNRDSADLLNKLKGMQQEIQELRGQLEVQTHELKALQEQQLSFYTDIDSRLRETPAKGLQASPHTELTIEPEATTATNTVAKPLAPPQSQAINTVTTPINTPSRSNPADEQISYLAAYDLVKNKRYDDALSAMQTFVLRYPQGGYTANAQYWLGELYMVKKDYTLAIEHFEIVLKHFSSSSKAAACSLKIGYALAASGKKAEAIQRLQQVLKNYPDTPTAQLAATKLKTLNAS